MRNTLERWTPVFTLAILYYLTGQLSLNLLDGIKIVNVGVFASEGIALAFVLHYGRRVIPGIFLGQFILAVTNGIAPLPSLEISLINSAEAYLAWILFHRLHLTERLESFRDILGLTALILLILQPFSALLSNLVLLWHHQTDPTDFATLTFSWWFGNVMGQLLFTPFLLRLFNRPPDFRLLPLLLSGAAFALYLLVLEILLPIHNPSLLMTLSLSVVILVVAYRGLLTGAFLSIVAAVIASYSVYRGVGVFAGQTPIDNAINYNLYVLTHIVTVWLLGILFEERQEREMTLEKRMGKALRKSNEQQLLMLQQNRLAQMGELISMIAHQWRQPLNNLSLVNQLFLAQLRSGTPDSKAIENFKKRSQSQIALMSQTIDDFRDFFRNQEQQEDFIPLETARKALELIAPVLEKNGIQARIEGSEACRVHGYANGFAQALLNLLNNAKDAMIQKETARGVIYVTVDCDGAYVRLIVEDEGDGIPSEILEHIFDPYFSTKKDRNGTGLGLYMSKTIIEEQMGGTLTAENGDRGARFIITLPAQSRTGGRSPLDP